MRSLPSFLFRAVLLVSLVSPWGFSDPSQACRFSVRDVGFVEIRPNPYRLYLLLDESLPRSAIEGAALTAFFDSNIEFAALSPEDWKTLPDFQGTELAKAESGPRLALVSPDEDLLPLEIDPPGDLAEGWLETFQSVANSPIRDAFLEQGLEGYCAFLFVEGEDVDASMAARETLDRVLEETIRYTRDIPKPVDGPPFLLTVSSDSTEERILLWSLGLRSVEPPSVALLFGKGRRIGPTLSGEDLNPEKIFEIASIVGLDCECGLDRSWMQGTQVPLVWDTDTRTKIIKSLGFDPESPINKIEISQILSRGGSSGSSKDGRVSDPLMGYSERAVSFEPLNPEEDLTEEAPDPPASDEPVDSATSSEEETAAPAPVLDPTATPVPLEPEQTPVAATEVEPEAVVVYSAALLTLILFSLSIFGVGLFILFRSKGR